MWEKGLQKLMRPTGAIAGVGRILCTGIYLRTYAGTPLIYHELDPSGRYFNTNIFSTNSLSDKERERGGRQGLHGIRVPY